MKANGAIGVRWMPIYGKIGLLAELPVHFQFYLWGGGGAGTFRRESIIYCERGEPRRRALRDWRTENKVTASPEAPSACASSPTRGGPSPGGPRQHLPGLLPRQHQPPQRRGGRRHGQEVDSPGLTHSVVVDLGYTFIF